MGQSVQTRAEAMGVGARGWLPSAQPPVSKDHVAWAELEQRRERRQVSLKPCSYEIVEANGMESVTIESGSAYSLNHSRDGISLLLSHAPLPTQCLEVHQSQSFGRRTVSVFEVRWTRPVHIEGEGELYVVGCRRLFGPCRYLQF